MGGSKLGEDNALQEEQADKDGGVVGHQELVLQLFHKVGLDPMQILGHLAPRTAPSPGKRDYPNTNAQSTIMKKTWM